MTANCARALTAAAAAPTSFANLAVIAIREAWRIYQSNRYMSNSGTSTHASPRLDALAFFHGDQFAALCELLDAHPWRTREMLDIPQPATTCPCESCRTDYSAEAKLVASLPRQHRFRFAVGQKHYVQWKHNRHGPGSEIVRIAPQVKRSRKVKYLSAAAYLERLHAAGTQRNGRANALLKQR